MLLPLLAPIACDDPAIVELREDFQEALRASGWKQGAAAAAMRLSEIRLSEQLNGRAPFTALCRYPILGPRFAYEFNRLRMKRLGQDVIPVDVAKLTERVNRLVDIQFRMLKVTLTRRKKAKVC